MRLMPLLAAAAVVAVVATIAYVVHDEPTPSRASADEQLWTGTATMLQVSGREPTLCGGAMLLSLPPAGCGGARVRGLDLMTIPGAHRYPNGTITTPSVRLVGTWDGHALTVTRPAVLADPPRAEEPFVAIPGPSCPEPPGGWPFHKFDQQGMERVQAYVEEQPDAGTPRVDDSQRILTVPFTGDLDRHRAAIAALYDGPVCVELAEVSDRELQATYARVEADLKARGLELMSGGGGGSGRPYVEVTVVAVLPAEKAEIEASYDGRLRLESFLAQV